MIGTSHPRKEGVTYRISHTQENSLRFIAAMLDISGFICMCTGIGEIVTEIIGIIGDGFFILFFLRKGLRFGRSKGAASTLITNSVVEAVPFLNGVYPGFSIEVHRLVEIMNQEDEEAGVQTNAAEQAAQMQQMRLMRAAEIREQQLELQRQAEEEAA